jgi:hypothetical protein
MAGPAGGRLQSGHYLQFLSKIPEKNAPPVRGKNEPRLTQKEPVRT